MGNGLTLTECRDACHSAGYGFFGRENLASCHCGNAFNTSDTALVAAAECNCNAKGGASIGEGKYCVYEIGNTSETCSDHGLCNDHGDCDCTLPYVGAKCDILCPGAETMTTWNPTTCQIDTDCPMANGSYCMNGAGKAWLVP